MKIFNVTIGADPELFIINEETGKVVSSIGLIPGEKGDPYTSEDMPNGFGLETDNIVAEFNIPPCKSIEAFVNNIEYMKEYTNKFVKNINPKLGILCAASMEVDEDQLQSKEALEFGCSPDFNVYTESVNEKPDGASTNIRSCGLHIHLGYSNPNIDTSLELVKYLDVFLGIPSVLRDNDTRRRSLYGKAGCFRLCPYGVEYRSLSSYMMKDVKSIKFIAKQIFKAIMAFNSGSDIPYSGVVIHTIDNNDKLLAKKLILKYNLI